MTTSGIKHPERKAHFSDFLMLLVEQGTMQASNEENDT